MSIIKTRAIGEMFEWREVKLQVVECETCQDCYFCNDIDCLYYRGNTGYCGASNRTDNKSVIFKRINK